MGKIIPSTPDNELKTAVKTSSWNTLSQIYLSRDSGRTEQLNTANAIIAVGLSQITEEKPDLRSYEECEKAIYTLFQNCAEKNVRPTISSIALALGASRKQFLEACDSGQITLRGAPTAIALPNDVWKLFVNLRDNYIAMLEGFLEANIIHPSSGIFLLKNNGGYKDSIDHNYNVTKTVVDVAALAEKYSQEMDV